MTMENESMLDNGSLSVGSGVFNARSMPSSEILTIFITGTLGLIGMVFNVGVLVVTYRQRLIKKDYRMIYYCAVTIGDLMFATHSFVLAFNIAFKEFYVFRISAVCATLITVFGLVAYQWSAMCIIVLLVDLLWTLKTPFTRDNRKQARMSRVSTVFTFVIGNLMAVAPLLVWNDLPFDLPFCSIANLYGQHWDFYQHQAVIVLSILVGALLVVSGVLLRYIYGTHYLSGSQGATTSRNTSKRGVCIPDRSACRSSGRVRISPEAQNEGTPVHKVSDVVGVANIAFVSDESLDPSVCNIDLKPEAKRKSGVCRPEKLIQDIAAQESKRDAHRREFMRACGNVGVFTAAYLGCCMPYYVTMLLGLGCGSRCNNDNLESRVIRALVATALYLLPVVDPILYTKRFKVFRQAALDIWRLCYKVEPQNNTRISITH